MSEITIQNDLEIKNKLDSNLVIVGVGASAGGLEALQDFFTAMPTQIPFAFVVIQHLSPDYKSLMDELLARCTNIKIDIAFDGMSMEANHIYLIPPGKNISVYHDKLYLDSQNHKKSLNLPIDIFFRSLAKDKGSKSIGIVLSGTGSDGTMGIKAIKEAGGMVMVQEESTARFDGMPRSAIATGLVDFILPPSKMPEALEHFIKHPMMRNNAENSNILTQNIDEISKIALILRDHTGVDFSYYKENTIVRRLERRISINRMDSLKEYVIFLNESNKEKDTLYRELLIGVTRFFRDSDAFESLEKNIFPKIDFKNKKIIRIWSTGCSTGEEVYSLAILLKEFMEKHNYTNEIKIFATDIDKFALDQANTGFYPESLVSDVDPMLLVKYFNKRENGYQVHETIRKMVVFATHNLLKDPPFSKLDLLVCRNLFIYLKPEIQKKILSSFYYSLYPDGYLFLGSSETLGNLHEAYESVDSKWKIYKVKSTFRPSMIKDMPAPVYYSNDNKPTLLSQLKDGKGKKFEVFAEQLLSSIAPPSVLLDEEDNIIHIINDVNRFISMKPGKFSMNLYHHLHPDLVVIVGSQLYKLKKESTPVTIQNVTGLKGLEDSNITIEAKRVLIDNMYFNLLVFKETSLKEFEEENQKVHVLSDSDTKRYKELQAELQYTKENLQATVEELETSNEELQSSNEELIASNEELQSTNEELQSVNEELFTVNYEYQSKIEELTKINTDIHNLLKHTEVGALYLDSNLCIRKFTPLVASITNIMPSDIGRPFTHISTVAIYPSMSEDIQKVSENLQAIEREIETTEKKNYLVKILPYRTETNAIDGILLTFTEISKLKEAKSNNVIINQRLQDALELGKMAWWEWDATTGKVTMDEKKATMIGYILKEFPDTVEGICSLIHPDDYEETMQIMRDHLSGKLPEWLATYRIKRKDGSYGWYYDRGMITHRDLEGKPLKLMGTVIEVSHLKQIEEENLWFKQLYAKTIDYLETPLMVYNNNGIVLAVNDNYSDLLQTDKSALEGIGFNQSIEKFYLGRLKLKPEQHAFAIAKNTMQKVLVENIHIHVKNQILQVAIQATPIVDANGNLQAVMIELKTP